MDEFVVRGGLVYDGTGAPPAQADVWVRDGEIMAVGVDAGGSDIPAVDASGCVVTPGFVDIHRHCDAAPLRDADFGRVELAQGITCALAGNCGLAPVPLDVSRHGEFYEYIEPVVGKVPPHVCYNSYAGYVRALEQTELPLHLGFLAGIGAVRCAVKGFSAQPFTKRELEQAVALVDQAMEAGACGASLGIMYRPECYTAPSEYNALLRPVALRDGLLCTHIRGEGDSLVESVREVIGIARRAGVRLNISHFKATGVHNWRDKFFGPWSVSRLRVRRGRMLRRIFIPMTEVQLHCCRCCRQRWRNTRRRSLRGMRVLRACGRSFTANIPAGTIWSPPSDGSASSSVRWRERNTHGIRGKTLSGQRRCTAVGIRRT